MDYEAAIAYINQFIDYERSPDFSRQARLYNLNRIAQLLELLENPHEQLKIIHIAGSKGKGSTAAIIASILQSAGYKTGLFTSPHLITPRERCRIDNKLISEADVAHYIQKIKPAIDIVSKTEFGKVSFFEIYTALAFYYFADRGTDFAVIEVGLGGRLDATNVVKPQITVITPISLEHTAILGETYAEIATEKAGIIKDGRPLVLAPQPPAAQAVLVRIAAERNAPIVSAGTIHNYRPVIRGQQQTDMGNHALTIENGTETLISHGAGVPAGQHFELKTESDIYRELTIPLLGEYQLVNAATAIAAIECLKDIGYSLTRDDIYRGTAHVEWHGRMQMVSPPVPNKKQARTLPQQDTPRIMLDGAHSPDSAQLLCREIRRNFRYNRLIFIVSLMRDKAIRDIGEVLCQNADAVILTEVSDNPRVMPAYQIQQIWCELCEEISVCLTPCAALTSALSDASLEDLICVTGSLYLVGECLDLVKKIQEE